MATVRLPTVLRVHAAGQSTVDVQGVTLKEIVNNLVETYPGVGGHLLSDDGSIARFVNVYVNDEDVRYLDKLDTTVGESDEVSILPAVAGGAY
jgi:molybdopterin converting factor small subunit